VEMMERLVAYANQHGKSTNRPYFSVNGKSPITGEQWSKMRAKWNHIHGITNVWSEPPVRGNERVKSTSYKAVHANQKSLKLIQRIILASSDTGDIVWEPFGGLCSAAVASLRTGRRCYAAEIQNDFFAMSSIRLNAANDLFSTSNLDGYDMTPYSV